MFIWRFAVVGGTVHELLVVCVLTLTAAILLCLTLHFHLFTTQTG